MQKTKKRIKSARKAFKAMTVPCKTNNPMEWVAHKTAGTAYRDPVNGAKLELKVSGELSEQTLKRLKAAYNSSSAYSGDPDFDRVIHKHAAIFKKYVGPILADHDIIPTLRNPETVKGIERAMSFLDGIKESFAAFQPNKPRRPNIESKVKDRAPVPPF